MAKRVATTELNHENWDQESKPEEAGVFARAADEIMEKRVLKTARRRLGDGEGSGSSAGSAKSAFSALTAFKATPTTNSSPFSFLANIGAKGISTPVKPSTNAVKAPSINGASKNTENGTHKKEETSDTTVARTNPSSSKAEKEDDKTSKKPTEYFAKLKGLNESVTQWIKSHVDSNPFCILTPIFRDYEKYLKEIEAKHGTETEKTVDASEQAQGASNTETSKDATTVEKKSDSSTSDSTEPPFSWPEWKPEKTVFSVFGNVDFKSVPKSIFGNVNKLPARDMHGKGKSEKNPFLESGTPLNTSDNKTEDDKKTEIKSSASSFGSTHTSSPIFSFGQSPTTTSASAGFSFGSAKPFSFAPQAVKPQDSEEKPGDAKDDDDGEPPKPQFKPITEEGAVYEQRCKVFVKKDGNFTSRGIGILFLKPTPNGKTQLIVRAETALGNLILNILLTESIPVKRMNDNMIMLVCLPEAAQEPVPVLLRVKTEKVADTLLETLMKYRTKGQS